MAEGVKPVKISDLERQIEINQKDGIPLDKALEIAIKEREAKEKKMGPPQEAPKEAYEEQLFRLREELSKNMSGGEK